ncbi:hypothetical protein N7447_003439 [Penicillium robsamsonii]|uniref:uncharacterized protein n=1 Tax=Penicillium robsamsonii TaxID=1792511 RepID=UPI002548EC57|nr:uncharacterized protein N7447_003439 [Penicillium robsamsonii]KAJ5826676.1 hypothetical protein N7447_003439 [Penicillium robsamsonii]
MFHKCVSFKYNQADGTIVTPYGSICDYVAHYCAEFTEACGQSHIPTSAQYFLFLTVVSNNSSTHKWLNSLRHSDTESNKSVLIPGFSNFVISENLRLASHPSYPFDDVLITQTLSDKVVPPATTLNTRSHSVLTISVRQCTLQNNAISNPANANQPMRSAL